MSESDQNDYLHHELIEHSSDNGGLIPASEVLPDSLYVIPISSRPYFPAQVQPIVVDVDPWSETLKRVAKTPHQLILLSFYDSPIVGNEITIEKLSTMGCVAKVHNVIEESGKIQFIAQGLRRAKIQNWIRKDSVFLAQVSYPEPRSENPDEVKAYAMALINNIKELISINPLYTEELRNYLSRFGPNDPSPLADFAASLTTAKGPELQSVLNTVPLLKRMEKVLTLLKHETEVAKLQNQIDQQVNDTIDQSQRQFFLKEQLKVIQKELGMTKDDKESDVDEFRKRLEKLAVPEYAMKRIEEELRKLSLLETGSPEYGVTRNYLDWATSVPWGVYSEDNLDIQAARRVLDKHHDGLNDVKERIIEFLALGAYRGEISGSILLLVGPPGVGKTSIGRSIADALGRKFYRFSLGGMRDEAEIKGHRRTYIGAMPGKFVQALKDVEVSNPVIMLDEIDKLGKSFQGDPASALLEVLDPEQNKDFLDHYLDLRVDLSKALFVCTANQLDSIPGPLLDRMDVIRLSGYITEEKIKIAKHHLWPRALDRAGVKRSKIKINQGALRAIVEGYAREAGVRNLEKNLNKIIRKAVVRFLDNPDEKLIIKTEELPEFLGNPIFKEEKNLSGVGVVTGLAWTALGGATLDIEATVIHNNSRNLKLTGQLGDVMRESAEIAYSYVSSHLEQFAAKPTFYDKASLHLHVPEGATPKDGPSAGITMATALLSLALDKKIKRNIAMTGELTLTGKVLPVGGIREKVIAARRQKIKSLILPESNRGDYEELPEYLKTGMTISFADTFSDVVNVLF
ncbi:MAG: endopeptidase La [Pseudomonadales bacterium]|nr:endopeptidase La [Pseudomonadales bacterium]